ncbi:short-chain fatty acid transporter [Helicobacter sp. 12S02232-10]|uniref:short-chain fatty acid transporter n=1 Tax=Helicobacter sp. 12S02232-10 TaxID=1476197 RepID=UPI000BA56728|nr:TIGR00366 family protein [Helicobacter sp. 12S02232-10]PAF49941.1 short-chain fatty acid transporter [Helicobacter sp. 12S02232-10]
MISKIADSMTKIVVRYLPHPLIFAILLTFIMLIISIFLQHSVIKVIHIWGDGFFNLLTFSMQMSLIIVSGYALASSSLVSNLLKKTASLVKTPRMAAFFVTLFGLIACSINWGFGLIVGAIFAKEMARQVKGCDYGLLIACAYIGFLSWGAGFSGSMPLLAATPGNPVESISNGIIPLSQTIFTSYNAFVLIGLIVVMPIATYYMLPKNPIPIDPKLLQEKVPYQEISKNLTNPTPAQKLESSRILSLFVVLIGIIYLGVYIYENGFNFTINTINLIFIILGFVLHKTPMAYMNAVTKATASCAGIIIQFPFYASIALLMEKSGFGEIITQFFIQIANKDSFALTTFISSAIINFAVPSGGGHWVIQGPFIIGAAKEIGADLGKATMAIAYGEQFANMIQPFWAIPALAIAGLGVRDIMGFCVTAMIISAPIFLVALILF